MGKILVKVKYFAMIRDITGKSTETIILKDGSRVSDVFLQLSETYGDNFTSYVFNEDGGLKEGITLLINRDRVEPPYNRAILNDGDEVVILPPIAGGRDSRY